MDWLKCNICFNNYNDSRLRPRSLSCGHTFCEKCLENTFQNKALTCPQCRKVFNVDSVVDIPINFVLEGLLKSLNLQDASEGATSKTVLDKTFSSDKHENQSSLKSFLEQQQRSFSAQKELLKTSAGMCYEHSGNELTFRCSSHKSWVCEKCIEERGDHPKQNCTIISFKEEIENRKQDHKISLDNDEKSCGETVTIVENHISNLKEKRNHHICLAEALQELVILHQNEDKNLQNEITFFENIIEKGKIVLQRLLEAEKTTLNVETLDESNAARDIVECKKLETEIWVKNSDRKVDEGKLKLQASSQIEIATKRSLKYREESGWLQEDLHTNINQSEENEASGKKVNSMYTESMEKEVHEDYIPQEFIDRLQKEKWIKIIRRKERNEDHLYMCVQVVLEDAFNGHQGFDLYDPDKVNYRSFRVKKAAKLHEFLVQVADTLKYPVEQIHPWPLNLRTNQTNRPTLLDLETELHKPLIEISNNSNPWSVFIETVPPDSGLCALPIFDEDSDVLLFFKYYDPRHKCLHYSGHHYMHISFNVQKLVPLLNERAGLPLGTKLALFEEIKPNLVERLADLDRPLEKVLDEPMDGDIIVFQRADLLDEPSLELPSCRDYFRDLFYRVEVTFYDKTMSSDTGFAMELSQRINYDQMAQAVAQRLGTDPYLLQFFRSQSYRDGPGNPVRYTYEGTLKDMLVCIKPRQPKKMYYQQLRIRINELENKKQFKCMWLGSGMKEEQELVLYPNKNGTVADLLHEARKQVTMADYGSAKLRLLEISSYKITSVPGESITLNALSTAGTRSYRIEEIPLEELHIAKDELLIPVAHFHKEIFSTFGIPFLFKIKQGELFSHVRDRIQMRLDVPDKEFEKYRLAIVMMGRPTFIIHDEPVNLSDFRPHLSQTSLPAKPWMGVEHRRTPVYHRC